MNKSTTYLLIFSSIFCNFLFAQDIDSKDKLLDLIAIETCDCVNNKDLDFSTIESTQLELEYGLCVMESYSKNKELTDKYLEVSFDDEKSLENLGVEVALKMMTHCSDFMMKLAGDYAADELEATKEDVVIVGKITNIQESQFNIVEIRDTGNRVQKLLWLEYFEGGNLFDDLGKLKKKKVKVTYIEKELYDPKIDDYRNFKIIKKIALL